MTTSRNRQFRPIRIIYAALAVLGTITILYTSHLLSLLSILIPNVFEDTTTIDQPRILSREYNNQVKYMPLNCAPGMDGFRSSTNFKDWIDPNEGQMFTNKTVTNPPFWISVNTKTYDKMRWQIKEHGYYYEKAQTNAYVEILGSKDGIANDKDSNGNPKIVMDVGSNIGWFSLLSASLGQYHVHTFEASPTHLVRLCESLILNNWTGMTDHKMNSSVVNLYNYGVGQHDDTKLNFLVPRRNPGEGRVLSDGETTEETNKHKLFSIDMLSLDGFAQDQGWISNLDNTPDNTKKPTIAILKIDVEGVEHAVIQGSKKLLNSGLVENIFMELNTRREHNAQVELISTMIDASYRLHKFGTWAGPDHFFKGERHNNTYLLVEDILNLIDKYQKNKAGALNLWWKLEV